MEPNNYFYCQIIQHLRSILQTNIIITFVSVIITSIKTLMEIACVVVEVYHITNAVIPLHQTSRFMSIFNFQFICFIKTCTACNLHYSSHRGSQVSSGFPFGLCIDKTKECGVRWGGLSNHRSFNPLAFHISLDVKKFKHTRSLS